MWKVSPILRVAVPNYLKGETSFEGNALIRSKNHLSLSKIPLNVSNSLNYVFYFLQCHNNSMIR